MWKIGLTRGTNKEVSDRLDALEKATREHQAALESLARMPKQLELEWNEVYDKVNRLMGRISKRARLSESPESNDQEATHTPAPPQAGSGHHATLQRMRARFGR